jgi:hypothetical protein
MQTSPCPDATAARDQFLTRFICSMRNGCPGEIEGYGIGGSLGRSGSPDKFSDIDLFLLVRAASLDMFFKNMPSFANDFGHLLLFRGPTFVLNYGYSFTAIYEGPILCQYNVNTRKTLRPGPNIKFTRILRDRTGFYRRFVRSQQKVLADPHSVFSSCCSLFWLRCLNVCKALARNQIWMAIRYIGDIRQQMVIVKRLRTGFPPKDFSLSEKNLECDVGSRGCAFLIKTLPAPSSESIHTVLEYCIHWFRRTATEYAIENGLDYPSRADRVISKLCLDQSCD